MSDKQIPKAKQFSELINQIINDADVAPLSLSGQVVYGSKGQLANQSSSSRFINLLDGCVDESSSDANVPKILQDCLDELSNCNFSEQLREIFRQHSDVFDVGRLQHNIKALIESAQYAICIRNKKDFTFSYTNAAPYWVKYFLKNSRNLHLRYRKVPVVGVESNRIIQAPFLSYIYFYLIESQKPKLIESPTSCLLPLGKDLLQAIEQAWFNIKSSDSSVVWEFRTQHFFQSGDSLSAAVSSAIYSLYQDSPFDDQKIILGAITKKINPEKKFFAVNGLKLDNWLFDSVGYETEKLQTAFEKGFSSAAIIDITYSEENNSRNLEELSNLKSKGLKLKYVKDLADIVEFTEKTPHFINIPEKPLKEYFVPRKDLKTLKEKILSNHRKIRIWQMSGYGKTSLVLHLVDNKDWELCKLFPDSIIWIKIGQQPTLFALQKELFSKLLKHESFVKDRSTYENHHQLNDSSKTFASGMYKSWLKELMANKRCLIILDDVWETEHLEAFDIINDQSCLLFTTQSRDVDLKDMIDFEMQPLESQQALEILSYYSKQDIGKLPKMAETIAKDISYHPYALAIIGSASRNRLESNSWIWDSLVTELQEGNGEFLDPQNKLRLALSKSIEQIPSDWQLLYNQLAVFYPNTSIPVKTIAMMWKRSNPKLNPYKIDLFIAQLLDRNLLKKTNDIQGKIEYVKIPDVFYFFHLQKYSENKYFLHRHLIVTYEGSCKDRLLENGDNDGYYFQHLTYHLRKANRIDKLEELLLRFSWLAAKLNFTNIISLIADFEAVELFKEEHKLLRETLILSRHILQTDKDQLAGQLLARLFSKTAPEIQRKLIPSITSYMKGKTWLRPLNECLTPPESPLIASFPGHDGEVTAVAISSDNKFIISASDDKSLKIWDLLTGQYLRTMIGHDKEVTAVAVSRNNKFIISASSDKSLKIWDLLTGQYLRTMIGHNQGVTAIAISLDSKFIISASDDGILKLWDLDSGHDLNTIKTDTKQVISVEISVDNKFVFFASIDSILKKWDLISGKCTTILTASSDESKTVSINANNKIAVFVSADKIARIWDLDSQKCITITNSLMEVTNIVLANNDKLVVFASSNTDSQIDEVLNSKNYTKVISSYTRLMTAIAVSPDSNLAVSGSDDGTLKLWDLQVENYNKAIFRHKEEITAVAISSDSKLVISVSADGILKLWDLQTENHTTIKSGHDKDIIAIAISSDTKFMVSASLDNTLKLWDLESKSHIKTINTTSTITALTLVGKDRVILASWNKIIELWDLTSGKCIGIMFGHSSGTLAVAITTDNKRVVSGCADGTLKVWDIDSCQCLGTMSEHTDRVESVAITTDNKRVVSSCADGTLKVWDIDSCQCLGTMSEHIDRVESIVITSDNRFIISVSWDNTIRVWSLQDCRESCKFIGDSPLVTCDISPDNLLVVGDRQGQVYFLQLET